MVKVDKWYNPHKSRVVRSGPPVERRVSLSHRDKLVLADVVEAIDNPEKFGLHPRRRLSFSQILNLLR